MWHESGLRTSNKCHLSASEVSLARDVCQPGQPPSLTGGIHNLVLSTGVMRRGAGIGRATLACRCALQVTFDALQAKVIGALTLVEGQLDVITFGDEAGDKHVLQRVHPA